MLLDWHPESGTRTGADLPWQMTPRPISERVWGAEAVGSWAGGRVQPRRCTNADEHHNVCSVNSRLLCLVGNQAQINGYLALSG
jgi:hypothetical protein